MPENKDRKLIPSQGGVFNDLTMRIKLIIRLMGDSRINPLLKLLPIGSVLYLIIPDFLIGPLDDVMVLWLGSYLFVELCPPEIVAEHIQKLTQTLPGEWHDAVEPPGEDVIEGEFRDMKE